MSKNPQTKIFVQAKIIKSSFDLPKSLDTKLLLFANGAGVAPMRGILQRKIRAMTKTNEKLGLIGLFFGTKTKGDLLFEGDFATGIKMRALNDYITTFSRDPVKF